MICKCCIKKGVSKSYLGVYCDESNIFLCMMGQGGVFQVTVVQNMLRISGIEKTNLKMMV